MPAQFTPWSDLDEPGRVEAIEAAAGTLRDGRLVIAPTDTVYGVFARADRPEAVAALRQAAGDTAARFTWHTADREDLDILDLPTAVHRRFCDRLLPGRVRLEIEQSAPKIESLRAELGIAEGVVDDGHSISVRIPDHRVPRKLAREAGGPLIATRVDVVGFNSGAASTLGPVSDDAIGAVIDAGRLEPGIPSTKVSVTLSGAFEVAPAEAGGVTEADVMAALNRTILFVCTGNTCRSPMAEAIAKDLVAKRPLDGVNTTIGSAGVAAMHGTHATPEAEEAMAAMGLDLTQHSSRPLTPALLHEAEAVFAMTPSHRDAAIAIDPSAAEKVLLLDPSGEAIDDPFGGPLALYEQTAARLRDHIAQRLTELEP